LSGTQLDLGRVGANDRGAEIVSSREMVEYVAAAREGSNNYGNDRRQLEMAIIEMLSVTGRMRTGSYL
jgi:hypothetical protein